MSLTVHGPTGDYPSMSFTWSIIPTINSITHTLKKEIGAANANNLSKTETIWNGVVSIGFHRLKE